MHLIQEEENEEDHSESGGQSRRQSSATAAAGGGRLVSGREAYPAVYTHQPQLATADYFESHPHIVQQHEKVAVHERLYALYAELPKPEEKEKVAGLTAEHTFHPHPTKPPKSAAASAGVVFDRLYEERKEREEWQAKAEASKAQKEMAGYIPTLVTEDYNQALAQHHEVGGKKKADGVHVRLYNGRVEYNEYYEHAAAVKVQKELEPCTFVPEILDTSTAKKAAVAGLAVEVGKGGGGKKTDRVHDRLYNGVVERKEYYEQAAALKERKEVEACTFLPEILDTSTAKAAAAAGLAAEVSDLTLKKEKAEVATKVGGRKYRNVWDRLYKAKDNLEEKKAWQRQAYTESTSSPFQPTLMATSPVVASVEEGTDVAGRLYKEYKSRQRRLEERRQQTPPGCTFEPTLATHPKATAAPKKKQTGRTEAMYAQGTEKVKRDLERDLALRPARPKPVEEECTFHPRTNWSNKGGK